MNLDLKILASSGKFESVDLPPNAGFSMEDNNPLFAKDFMEGTYSLPLTLPPTPRNQLLFGFPELQHIANRPTTKIRARLFGQDQLLHDGELILRAAGTKGYRINFQSKASLLTNSFNELQLRDLPFEPIELMPWDADNTHWAEAGGAKYVKMILRDQTQLPNPARATVNETDFESLEDDAIDTRMQDLVAKIQAGGFFAEYVINANPPEFGGGSYIELTVGLGATEIGLEFPLMASAEGEWEYSSSWVIPYNLQIDQAINDYYADNHTELSTALFPTMRNPLQFASLEAAQIKPDINAPNEFTDFQKSLLLFNPTKDYTEPNRVNRGIIPHFKVWHVFEKIEETTNIHVEQVLEYLELYMMIFVNTHAINYFEEVFPGTTISTFANVINPAEHIPDWSVNELFAQLRKLFGIGYNFDEDQNTLTFVKLADKLRSAGYTDYTHKANPEYELSYSEEPGIILGFKGEEGETEGIVTVGSGKEDYRSEIGSVKAETVLSDSQFPANYKIPILNEEGTWYGEVNEFQARLAFYFGEQPFGPAGEYLYRLASHDNYDMAGNQINENFNVSLAMEGDLGIYETYLRKLGDVLAYNDPEKKLLYWNVLDLTNFRYENKYRIGQVNYMIKKLNYEVRQSSGLQPVTAEVVRVD